MSRRKHLTHPGDTAYLYDGGLKGFYTCVHESVYTHELPPAIWAEGAAEMPALLPHRRIAADGEKAARVRNALAQKVSPRARALVEAVFLSCLPEKELPMLRFVLMAFERGSGALNMRQDPDVAKLLGAERHLTGEAHLYKGFVRFSDVDGKLIASIRPKNFVLPFLAEHFTERYAQEDFLIYDKTHRAALLSIHGRGEIVPMEAMPAFAVTETEAAYRALWKRFYDTTGIASRENPRCRMSHMPKRYWSEMTEMQALR